jgi:hypothetical protein
MQIRLAGEILRMDAFQSCRIETDYGEAFAEQTQTTVSDWAPLLINAVHDESLTVIASHLQAVAQHILTKEGLQQLPYHSPRDAAEAL